MDSPALEDPAAGRAGHLLSHFAGIRPVRGRQRANCLINVSQVVLTR